MSKTPTKTTESSGQAAPANDAQTLSDGADHGHIFSWVKSLMKTKPDSTLREVIEEYIEEPEDIETETNSISAQERELLSNILKMRDMKVFDVMIPRANIVAIDITTTKQQLFALLAEKQFSRIPVYRGTLDEVLGTVHIKDIIGTIARGEDFELQRHISEVPIVSPSMHVLDLLLEMRQSSRHMALVVDEYGGIDGLVTVGNVIEWIIGEIDDEHDVVEDPQIIEKDDGSILADARVDITEFEDRYGQLLTNEEREDSDTLGGLVFLMAGRIPARGEILTHKSGMVFEVVDADARKINLLRIRNIPA